jgi:hypothetical protein
MSKGCGDEAHIKPQDSLSLICGCGHPKGHRAHSRLSVSKLRPTRLKPVQSTANKGCNPKALPLATAVGPWRECQQQANSWVRTQRAKSIGCGDETHIKPQDSQSLDLWV